MASVGLALVQAMQQQHEELLPLTSENEKKGGAAAAGRAARAQLPARSGQFKAGFVRKWMVVDQQGQASVFQPHKLEITQQMGVQLRDLRWVRWERPGTRRAAVPAPTWGRCSAG